MAEQILLDESGVMVTSSRFIVPGETYVMSGVASVKTLKHSPSIKVPLILIAIGVIAGVAGKEAIIGGIFLIAGIAWWILQKPKYTVVLSSASGEVEALTSKDNNFISRVVEALNETIVARE